MSSSSRQGLNLEITASLTSFCVSLVSGSEGHGTHLHWTIQTLGEKLSTLPAQQET